MATTFMNLSLPTPTVTLGPTWATELNTALEAIDEHDHTSGKGSQIPTAGLNINEDLDFNSQRIFDLKSTKFINNASTLTGSLHVGSVYMKDSNLYFTNGSGVAVQITSGGSIVSTPGAAQTMEPTDIASNLTILNTDTFVVLRVNTSASRTITLPLANSVSTGRLYLIKDVTGSAYTNNVTINPSGADTIEGLSSLVLNSDYGSYFLIGDGNNAWTII